MKNNCKHNYFPNSLHKKGMIVKMEGQIDILLATYNGEKYLREQIDSILNQTYKNIRLIVSDDCSKDGTRSYSI